MAIQIRRGLESAWESNNSNIVAGEPAITLDTGRLFVGTDNGDFAEFANVDNVPSVADMEYLLNQKAINTILDSDNYLIYGVRHSGYYDTSPHSSATYHYFEIHVESGKTYTMFRVGANNLIFQPRIVSKSGSVIVNNASAVAGMYSYTADFNGTLYVTFYNNDVNYIYQNKIAGTFDAPFLSDIVMTDDIEKGYATSPVGAYSAVKNTLNNIINDKNLLYYAYRIVGKYMVVASNQLPRLGNNSAITTFKIYLKTGTYKVSAGIRFICQEYAQTYILSGSAQTTEYTLTISTDDIYYLCFVSADGSGMYIYNTAESDGSNVGGYGNAILKSENANKGYFLGTADTLADTESISLPTISISKNVIYSFVCKITSFGKVLIGRGSDSQVYASWVEVDGTNVVIKYYKDSLVSQTFAHGLTISDYLYVTITTDDNYKAVVTLFSNGEEYSTDPVVFYANCRATAFAKSDGSTLTDCVFNMTMRDSFKNTYLFGDSYMNYEATNRWCYYLVANHYIDNVLINAFGGASSLAGQDALTSMGENLHPKFALWAFGMNDGNDTSSAPNSQWLTGVNAFLAWCKKNKITPILATIPTTPNCNNEKKNAFVKNSGYRYVDFASSVGAQANGTWFTGMLASDNTHPTIIGAIALYHQALIDIPEITMEL